MKKILIDTEGDFMPSDLLDLEYREIAGKDFEHNTKRDCPVLIQLFEKYGNKISDNESKLKIVKIPENIDFVIMSSEIGGEWVADKNRMWF
jgi:hypothetical protein